MLKRVRRNDVSLGQRGFGVLQLVITIAIISIVSTFAVMGITRARAHMRLSASEREIGSYLEQARTDSIRRHAKAPNAGEADVRATISVPGEGGTSFTVMMDFDKDGTIDAARTIPLQYGVTFRGVAKTVTFDWRGRTSGEISIGLVNERGDTSNINITGSGDITLNTEVFQDEDIPAVALNNSNVSGDVIQDDKAVGWGTDEATTTPTPTPGDDPHDDDPPNDDDDPPTDDPPSDDPPSDDPPADDPPTDDPPADDDPPPTTDPTPTETPIPCTMSVSPSSVELDENGGTNITVTLSNLNGSSTVTASSSNSGQIQVTPSSRTLTSSGSASFAVTVKKNGGSVSFSSTLSCGSGSTTITIKAKK